MRVPDRHVVRKLRPSVLNRSVAGPEDATRPEADRVVMVPEVRPPLNVPDHHGLTRPEGRCDISCRVKDVDGRDRSTKGDKPRDGESPRKQEIDRNDGAEAMGDHVD